MSIGSAVFAQLTVECPITVQCDATLSLQNSPFPWGSGLPSNTWYLGPTRVIMPNGMSIGSAIFVWVPNAMLYTALSIGKKPPKPPLPLGILLPCRRRTEPRPQATCAKKMVKIARAVLEICWRSDRQTDRHTHTHTQTCWSQYFAVKIAKLQARLKSVVAAL